MAVLGVDACRDGWAGIVLGDGPDDAVIAGVVAPTLVALLDAARQHADIALVGVDMPIGLPDAGRRRADLLARTAVGPRRSSVFLTPVRAAITEPSYDEASHRNRALAGEGLSRQAYALRPKLLEADRFAAAPPMPVREVHPELSFAALAGAPLPAPKRTWAGASMRRSLLDRAGVAVPDDLGDLGRVAAVDDVLDAAVVAWTARRCITGTATCLPDPPEVFGDGLPAAIWA